MAMAQNNPLMYRYNSMEHFGDPSSKLLSLDALAIPGFRTPVGLRGGVAASPQKKTKGEASDGFSQFQVLGS
jgi:hypothetical protein